MPLVPLFRVLMGVALSATLATASLAAPVVVLSSSLPDLPPGSVVDSATPIELPAGGVLVFNDATGQTKTLTGPYSGGIGEEAGGQTEQAGLVGGLAALVQSRDQEQSRLGAIRATPGQHLRDAERITIAQSSTQCITTPEVTLWRPETMAEDARLTIRSGADEDVAFWPEGAQSLTWAPGLTPGSSQQFVFKMDFAPRPVEVILHFAPESFATPAELATWMGQVGCRRQAILLLEEVLNVS